MSGCEYHFRLRRYLLAATLAGGVRRAVCGDRRRSGRLWLRALMPLVLVPVIGAEPVVPIIAISAIFANLSRATAYLRYVDRRRVLIVIAAAALTTGFGAFGYTRLTNAGAALVIGAMLMASVPLRRLLKRRDVRIGDAGLAVGAVGYGVVVGG